MCCSEGLLPLLRLMEEGEEPVGRAFDINSIVSRSHSYSSGTIRSLNVYRIVWLWSVLVLGEGKGGRARPSCTLGLHSFASCLPSFSCSPSFSCLPSFSCSVFYNFVSRPGLFLGHLFFSLYPYHRSFFYKIRESAIMI